MIRQITNKNSLFDTQYDELFDGFFLKLVFIWIKE